MSLDDEFDDYDDNVLLLTRIRSMGPPTLRLGGWGVRGFHRAVGVMEDSSGGDRTATRLWEA